MLWFGKPVLIADLQPARFSLSNWYNIEILPKRLVSSTVQSCPALPACCATVLAPLLRRLPHTLLRIQRLQSMLSTTQGFWDPARSVVGISSDCFVLQQYSCVLFMFGILTLFISSKKNSLKSSASVLGENKLTKATSPPTQPPLSFWYELFWGKSLKGKKNFAMMVKMKEHYTFSELWEVYQVYCSWPYIILSGWHCQHNLSLPVSSEGERWWPPHAVFPQPRNNHYHDLFRKQYPPMGGFYSKAKCPAPTKSRIQKCTGKENEYTVWQLVSCWFVPLFWHANKVHCCKST